MENLLKTAQEMFKKDDLFLSASGLINSPLKVEGIKLSEVYKNTVVNTSGGILYSEGKWARKV